MQHGSVDHPTSYRLKKLGMRNTIEVTAEVCVNNFLMASVDQLVDTFDGVQRAAVSPIGVLFRLQIGLEDRFENQNCRHFRCPIPDGGHSQRPLLLPVRLRYVHPPYGQWLISSTLQLLRQFVQPSLNSVRLDVLEPLTVHSCCSTIGVTAFIGINQNVPPIHLVVQSIETKAGRFLRFRVQRRLQLLNTCGGYWTHRQSLCLRRFLRFLSTEAPSLHRSYPVSSVLRASPSPHTARPGSHELPVDPDCDHRWGFPCCIWSPMSACRRHYPGRIDETDSLITAPSTAAFPR